MPTDIPDVRIARLRAQLLVNSRFVHEKAPNRTYGSEIKKYLKWIHGQRESGSLPLGDKVVTRENLDHYFTMHQRVSLFRLGCPR